MSNRVNARITPQKMKPESWLGALLSRKPRYDGPTAIQLNYATGLCFQQGMSWEDAMRQASAWMILPQARAYSPGMWDAMTSRRARRRLPSLPAATTPAAPAYSPEMLAALPADLRSELLDPGHFARSGSPR